MERTWVERGDWKINHTSPHLSNNKQEKTCSIKCEMIDIRRATSLYDTHSTYSPSNHSLPRTDYLFMFDLGRPRCQGHFWPCSIHTQYICIYKPITRSDRWNNTNLNLPVMNKIAKLIPQNNNHLRNGCYKKHGGYIINKLRDLSIKHRIPRLTRFITSWKTYIITFKRNRMINPRVWSSEVTNSGTTLG